MTTSLAAMSLQQQILGLIRQYRLNHGDGAGRPNSKTLSWGDKLTASRHHHLCLAPLARAGVKNLTIINVDGHGDLAKAVLVDAKDFSDGSLVKRVNSGIQKLDSYVSSLSYPEEQWVFLGAQFGLIGKYICLGTSERSVITKNKYPFPVEYYSVEEFIKNFTPNSNETYAATFCFDIFLSDKTTGQLDLGPGLEGILSKLKTFNPIMILNALSKMSTNSRFRYSELNDKEAAHVIRRQLSVFGWEELELSIHNDPRRLMIESMK